MARKGLPKKYAKMGFKKGWKAYKMAKGATKRAYKKVAGKVKRKSTKKVIKRTTKKRVYRMAGKKKSPVRRRKSSMMTNRTINALINGATIGGTAIASTLAVNKIPVIRDQNSWVKAAAQAGSGILGILFSKNLMAKKAWSGVVAGALMSVVLPLLPEGMRVFGAARNLSSAELAELQTMGRPFSIAQSSQSMGRPVNVSTATAPVMGNSRGNRRYA